MYENVHNFTRGAALNRSVAARETVILSDDQIRRAAPSAFAEGAHESRSDRYAYVPTHAVIAGMRREGFVPVKAEQSRSRVDGKQFFTKHMITFRHADIGVARVGDSVPQVVLVNSHDGTSAYRLMAGLFRFVCSNGLIVSDGEIDAISVPHTGKVADRVIEGSFRVIEDARIAGEKVAAWRGIELAPEEQQVFARAAIPLRFEEEAAKPSVSQVLNARRWDDTANDLWTTFNRVQENLVKGGQRYRTTNGRRMATREVKSIDGQTNLNKALWRLADEMRAIKTGVAA